MNRFYIPESQTRMSIQERLQHQPTKNHTKLNLEMSTKSLMFVVPKHRVGSHAATIENRGFFVANFIVFKITAKAGLLDFSVIGSQSGWPSRVLGRNAKGSAFSILTYQSGKDYISVQRIKPQNTMRSNTIKGTPTGVSISACAEIRQLLEDFFGEASDAKRLEEDLFEMFQSTLLSMNDMGYDDRVLMRFCWTYRRLSQLMRDLEKLASKKSTLTQKLK